MQYSENTLFDNMISAKINPFKNERTLKSLACEEFNNTSLPIDITLEVTGVKENQVLFNPITGSFSLYTLYSIN